MNTSKDIKILGIEGLDYSGRRQLFIDVVNYLKEKTSIHEVPVTENDDRLPEFNSLSEHFRFKQEGYFESLLNMYTHRARKYVSALEEAEEGQVILSFWKIFRFIYVN